MTPCEAPLSFLAYDKHNLNRNGTDTMTKLHIAAAGLLAAALVGSTGLIIASQGNAPANGTAGELRAELQRRADAFNDRSVRRIVEITKDDACPTTTSEAVQGLTTATALDLGPATVVSVAVDGDTGITITVIAGEEAVGHFAWNGKRWASSTPCKDGLDA